MDGKQHSPPGTDQLYPAVDDEVTSDSPCLPESLGSSPVSHSNRNTQLHTQSSDQDTLPEVCVERNNHHKNSSNDHLSTVPNSPVTELTSASLDENDHHVAFEEIPVPQRRQSIASSIGSPDDIGQTGNEEQALDEPDFWDKISQYSVRMRKDTRFYFQHPYARILVAYLVTFCNFLIYAEDPVAHSEAECNIVAVGNIYSFVITKYPTNGWAALKVLLWLLGIVGGLILGKIVIHELFLKRLCKLQMFQNDMGSFMVMFLTVLVCLFTMSWVYNAILLAGTTSTVDYAINGLMNMRNLAFMKAAACGTWLGDFFTAWMVTDVMLQEKFYPGWAVGARAWWRRGKHRIILFWIAAALSTIIVVMVIATDWVDWDFLNRGFLPSNELSRAFLASFILVMDLLIVMQDWDFPHFINHFDIKLPGLNTADLKIELPQCLKRFDKITIHITGKWFNYGIIFLVMILDLNMWKNQIFYAPADFLQYTDSEGHIYSTRSDTGVSLNSTQLSFAWRNVTINPETNRTYISDDVRMNSKYLGYSLGVKAIAFIPALAGFIVFVVLIILYGRVKPSKKNPYVGRITKTPKNQKSHTSMFTVVRMKFLRKNQKQSGIAYGSDDGAAKAVQGQGYALNDTGPVTI